MLVSLRASTAAFAKDLDKASQLSFNTSKEIERSFKRIGGVIATELTAAVGAVSLAVAGAIENADKMGLLAHQAGLTAEQFTALAYAASLSDVSAQTLNSALVTLSKNLEKSSEATQEGAAAHSALNTLFRGSIPAFKDTNDAFLTIVARLNELGPGYQQTALASQIFGKNIGAQIVPMLATRQGMKQLADEAQRLGKVISEDAANRANQFDDTLIKLKDSVQGLALKVGVELLPYLQKFADDLLDVGENANTSKTNIKLLGDGIRVLASAVIAVVGSFVVVGSQVGQFATILKNVGRASVGLGTDTEELNQSEKNVNETFLKFVELIQNLWNPAVGQATEKLDTHGKKTVQITAFNQKLAEAYKSTVTQLAEEITKLTLGSAAAESYKLKTLGASDAQIKFVQTLREMINNLKAGKDALTGTFSNQQFIAGLKTSVDSVNELTDSTEKGFAVLRELTEGPFKDYIEKTQALKPLVDQNIISQEQYNEAIDKLKDKLGFVAVKLDPLAKLSKDFQKSIGEAFESAIIGARSFGDVLKGLLTAIEEAILRTLVFKSIADSLSGVGGIGGFIGGIFGAIAGGKAGGGSVSGGSAYLVGEKGPELFVPAMSGTIVPNGGAGQQVIYNIDARGADATVIEMRVRRAIAKSQKESVAMSVASVREMSLRTT